MNRLERIQRSLTKKTTPKFEIGDTVRVHVKVVEGEKERIQVYEGTVIARKGTLNSETFTVRKLSYNVGVERTFPIHSPRLMSSVRVVFAGPSSIICAPRRASLPRWKIASLRSRARRKPRPSVRRQQQSRLLRPDRSVVLCSA